MIILLAYSQLGGLEGEALQEKKHQKNILGGLQPPLAS
jgi:hypothetical protein